MSTAPVSDAPPERIDLPGNVHLRWLEVDDASAVARAVDESAEHLRPWMPWVSPESADPRFQRERLRSAAAMRARREEWQYGLFGVDDTSMLGSFGLMTRRGPGTLEIGYWLHVDAVGRGHAAHAVAALSDAACGVPGVARVVIHCDEANVRSAAIPRRLGFTLVRVVRRQPQAPGETGREMVWARPVSS